MIQSTLKSLIIETRTVHGEVFVFVGTAFARECGNAEWHLVIRDTDRRHKSITTRPLSHYRHEWINSLSLDSDEATDMAYISGWESTISAGYAAAFGDQSSETESIACMLALRAMAMNN